MRERRPERLRAFLWLLGLRLVVGLVHAGRIRDRRLSARDAAVEVHDRMPVFLPLGMAEAWMRETPEQAQALLDGFEVPPVAVFPVSRRVNAPKDDDSALIEPITIEATG